MSDVSPSPEAPWAAGLRGARANVLPGLVLQGAALLLLLAYYHHAPTQHLLEQLTAFRARTGLAYGIVATGIFGGVLPCLYLWANPKTRARYTFGQALGVTLFWAYKGLEVDLWYRLLAHVLGEQTNVTTVVTKMFVDQFVYCPIFAVPVSWLVYAWIETHYDTRAVVTDVRTSGWYRRHVLPMLISNMGVWVPTVCIVYALPTTLQLPLFNLVLCFFTLLLAHISQEGVKDPI